MNNKLLEELRLTDEEILEILKPILPPELYDILKGNAEDLAIYTSEYCAITCETVRKVLNHPKIHIEADNQELPSTRTEARLWPDGRPLHDGRLKTPQEIIDDMLIPNKDGEVWMKVKVNDKLP